jgi:PAS domain S-box-containing protein
VFDGAPIGVVVVGRSGRIVYVNRRQCENSLLRPEDFLGRDYLATFGPTMERAGLLDAYRRLFERGEPFEAVLPYYRRHSDGAAIAFSLRGYRIGTYNVLMTNIEKALADQQTRYEQLFENANDGIFVISRDGRFVAVNRKFAEMAGMPREEILGKTTELFLPGRFEESLRRVRQVLEKGHLGPYELEISTPRGPRIVSLNAFALVENGEPAAVMNIARDVTEEHREEELREALYRFSRDLARAADVSGIAEHLFERARTLLGATAGLLVLASAEGAPRAACGFGERSGWSDPAAAPLDAELVLAREALAAETPIVVLDFRSRASRPEGAKEPPGVVWAVRLGTDEAPEGVLLVGFEDRGPSEPRALRLFGLLAHEAAQALGRARLTDELREARDRALEASRMKTVFVANMSHEIRTPLNVILGFASLLGERLDELGDKVGAPYVEAMRRAGERLLRTIGGVLDIARIEARSFEVHPTRVDLAAVVRRAATDFTRLARDKGLELVAEIRLERAVVRFDEYCLTRCLENLLDNAVKFTPEGRIVVGLERDPGGELRITVTDTGVGIEASYLERLFEPFTQEDSSSTRRFEGAGLGLALAKHYVELNGARLSVASRKHAGSRFTIHFPLALELPGEEGGVSFETSSAGTPAATSPHGHGGARPEGVRNGSSIRPGSAGSR